MQRRQPLPREDCSEKILFSAIIDTQLKSKIKGK